MVCMHTADVPFENRKRLEKAGWECRLTQHMERCSDNLFTWRRDDYGSHRFDHVFTKLRLFEVCTDFDKVVCMDIDMLVVGDLDDLFSLPAPAAMVTGHAEWPHGEWVEGSQLFFGGKERRKFEWEKEQTDLKQLEEKLYSSGAAPVDTDGCAGDVDEQADRKNKVATQQSSWGPQDTWGRARGINAGLMLLAPNQYHFEAMLSQVQDRHHPEHIPGNGPEQDYLARFFADRWTSIDPKYNWQLHQMFNELAPHLNSGDVVARRMGMVKNACEHLNRATELEVEAEQKQKVTGCTSDTTVVNKYKSLATFKVIHYSGDKKPWDFISPGEEGLYLSDYDGWALFGAKDKKIWADLLQRKHWSVAAYDFDFDAKEILFVDEQFFPKVDNVFEPRLIATKDVIRFTIHGSPQAIELSGTANKVDADGDAAMDGVLDSQKQGGTRGMNNLNMLFVVVHAGKIVAENGTDVDKSPAAFVEEDAFAFRRGQAWCGGKLSVTFFAFEGATGVADFLSEYSISASKLQTEKAAVFMAYRKPRNEADIDSAHYQSNDRAAFLRFATALLFEDGSSTEMGSAAVEGSGNMNSTATARTEFEAIFGDSKPDANAGFFHGGNVHAGAMLSREPRGPKAAARFYGGGCDGEVALFADCLQVL
eukprot:g20335.t1